MKNKVKKIIIKVLIYLSSNRYIDFKPNLNCKIIFVMGMFRSGTSLTCQVLEKLGLKLSPNWMLLQGKGKLKNLNPNGFKEDFLFAQLSRSWFKDLKKDGSNPPSLKDVKDFRLKKIYICDFIKNSESIFKEDRISFINRVLCYLKLIFTKEHAFLVNKVKLVKIPMLVPFYLQLMNWMPNAQYLIVIRNPGATVKSSEKLTDKSNLNLYNYYYEHLVELKKINNSTIISYDNLINSPNTSVKEICTHYSVQFHKDASEIVDQSLIRNSSSEIIKSEYYEELYKEVINKG